MSKKFREKADLQLLIFNINKILRLVISNDHQFEELSKQNSAYFLFQLS